MPTRKTDHGGLPSTVRSLPIVLIRARENVMGPIRKMLADTGITEQQWRILRVLSESGPIDATRLADRASLLFPSLTRIAQTMKRKGLITQHQDPLDRRRQTIALTHDGQRVLDENLDQALEIIAGFKDRLGAQNYEQLLDLLTLLAEDETPPSK